MKRMTKEDYEKEFDRILKEVDENRKDLTKLKPLIVEARTLLQNYKKNIRVSFKDNLKMKTFLLITKGFK